MVDCLSMGMSDDFVDAIRSGATMIRIGTAIFGPRYYHTVPPDDVTIQEEIQK